MELNMNLIAMMRKTKMRRMNKQVGGSHYENLYIEPVQFFVSMNTNWFQGEVVKYCSRFLNKNGKEDLLKAQQVCQLATQFGLNQAKLFQCEDHEDFIKKYCGQFEYSDRMELICQAILKNNYPVAHIFIEQLMDSYYGKEE